MEVGARKLKASNGRHIRTVTVVHREDGKSVVFMEKLSARKAATKASELPESAWR